MPDTYTALCQHYLPRPLHTATETQRLARHYQQKLAALAALKKSLLHDAFRGAL